MKRQYRFAALAAAMALVWGSANAQNSSREERADEFSRSTTYADYLKGRSLRATQLVGKRVSNVAGETLGEIEELVIPTDDDGDMLVIVSTGGLLDVRDKLVALPYDDLRVSLDGDRLYIDRTEADLESAAAYDRDAEVDVDVRSRAATARSTERVRTGPSAATAAKASNVVLDAFDHRASDLIGSAVLDDRGESVGKVDDIVVSTEDDKLHAVIAIGGFAGFGAKLISLPFDDLQITADDDDPQVRIAMTGEQLEEILASRPEFRYERKVAQTPGTPRG